MCENNHSTGKQNYLGAIHAGISNLDLVVFEISLLHTYKSLKKNMISDINQRETKVTGMNQKTYKDIS